MDAAGVRAGMRVLDVGAGQGTLTRRLAAAVHPGGEVVAVVEAEDDATALRDELSAARVEAGVTVADLASVPFDAREFDVALRLSGGAHEAAGVMREMQRVANRALVLTWLQHLPEPEGLLARAWAAVDGAVPDVLQRTSPVFFPRGWSISTVRDVARFDSARQLAGALVEHLALRPLASDWEAVVGRFAEELTQYTGADGTLRIPIHAVLAQTG